VAALRAALERLLTDEQRRRRLGEEARRRAREHFSWEAATADLLELYRSVTAARDEPPRRRPPP
jgi:starch synthase